MLKKKTSYDNVDFIFHTKTWPNMEGSVPKQRPMPKFGFVFGLGRKLVSVGQYSKYSLFWIKGFWIKKTIKKTHTIKKNVARIFFLIEILRDSCALS